MKIKILSNSTTLFIVLFAGFFLIGSAALVRADYVNVAQEKSASQSSTAYGGTADKAIDGNTNGHWSNGSVTHTSPWPEGDPPMVYWQVDLGGTYAIDQIVVWNRTDASSNRLTNFYVSVETPNSTVWSQSFYTDGAGYPAPSLTIDLTAYDYSGNIVRIGYNTSGPRGDVTYPWVLNLAEVQVFSENGSPVPIPPALVLFGTGLLGLAGIRKKIRK